MGNKIVNDQEKVKKSKKRSKPPIKEEEKADLRDQIVKKLLAKANEDDLGIKVDTLWNQAISDRSEWLDSQETFLQDWDEFVTVEPQGIFENSSNLHIPMSLWVLRTYHARFMQVLFSPEPSCSVKSRGKGYVEKAPNMEKLMKYALMEWANDYQGIEESIDQWIWSWLSTGIGFIKWRWDKKFKRYLDVVDIPEEGLPRFEIDPLTGEEFSVPTFTIRQEEQDVIKKVFDGPKLEFIPHEDVVVVGPDITDTNNADAVIHRQYLTADQLWTLANTKVFDTEEVERVIQAGLTNKSSSVGGMIKNARSSNAKEASADKNHELDRYEILEAYIKYDVDGSGLNSDVIVWVSTQTRRILRATYLHRINKAGECPIVNAVFHKRSGQNTGMPIGLAEMLHPISRELDMMHNLRIDFGMISTVPFGFYRSGSSLDPQVINIEPGKMIPVDNPTTDVYFPNLGNKTLFGFQEENALYTMIQRLTGISDMSLGTVTSTQGPTRTATGANMVTQEMNVNLDVPLQRLNRGWRKALQFLMHMLQQRVTPGMEFKVTEDDGVSSYLRLNSYEDIAGDFCVEVSPTTATSNKSIQIGQAQQILQLAQNPLFIQTGIITPQNIYEAIKNYLKHIGIKDISKFINSSFENQIVLTPGEEAQRLMAGEQIPVLPQADHDGFIAYAQDILNDNEKLGAIGEQQAMMLKAQLMKHQQMKQALDQMAAQQANAQQMQMNAQMSPGKPQVPAGNVGEPSMGGLPE